jgi:hypothetical protein
MESIHIVIETEDIEIILVRAYALRADADKEFERIAIDGQMQEFNGPDMLQGCPGTERLAGDDAHAVQLLIVPIG